jgi:hypothetical protein
MRVAGTIKALSAVAVFVCLFLPITKCDQAFSQNTTYGYSWSQFNVREAGSWMLLLVFFWPLIFVLIRLSMRQRRGRLLVRILEPLLAAGSAYVLHLQTLFTSGFAIGGLVAFWSLVCFGLASLAESTIELVAWRRCAWSRV